MADKVAARFQKSIVLPLQFIAVMWIVQIIQEFFHLQLGQFGLLPRDLHGVLGIFTAPFIHGSWSHLISNSIPLFVLGAMMLFFYPKTATKAIFWIYILTGVSMWLFARHVYHIGASGVVYGMVTFIFWTGVFRRNIKAIALGLIVAFYYGSLIWGILPGQEGISWEGHLLGALAGIFVAYWFKKNIEQDEQPKKYSWELEGEKEKKPFLPQDIFKN